MSTIQTFILSIVKDRVCFGGLVSFSHLKTMDALTGANVHEEFEKYCKQHGCTLSVREYGQSAPWSDFENFLLGKYPDD